MMMIKVMQSITKRFAEDWLQMFQRSKKHEIVWKTAASRFSSWMLDILTAVVAGFLHVKDKDKSWF